MTGILLDANFENSDEEEYLEVCLCELICVLDLQFALRSDSKAGCLRSSYVQMFHGNFQTKVVLYLCC